jgi:hypothetical protein
MKSGLKLRLKPVGEGKLIEGEFGKYGVLFLMSGSLGLTLSPVPDTCALIYAVFLIRRKKIFAAPFRGGLSLKACAFTLMKDKGFIEVCSKKLMIDLDKGKRAAVDRKVRKTLLVAVLLLMCAAFLANAFYVSRINESASSDSVRPKAPEAKPDMMLLEEARMHMRAGMGDQAKLTLMEAVERNPTNKKASDMLRALEDSPLPEKFSANTRELDAMEEAKAIYEAGKERMQEGDVSAAHGLFQSALAKLSPVRSAVHFKPALLAAMTEARKMQKAEAAPKLLEAKRLLEAAREKKAEDAVGLLASALALTSAVVKTISQNDEASSLHTELRRELEAISNRWLVAAQAAERLSGCGKALSEYVRMAAALQMIKPDIASAAREAAERCRASKGKSS